MPGTVARCCHRDNETDPEKLGTGKKIRPPDSKLCFFFLQVLEYTGIKQGAVSFTLGRIPKDFLEICKVKNNIMD